MQGPGLKLMDSKFLQNCVGSNYKDESVRLNHSDKRLTFIVNSAFLPKYDSAFESITSMSCFIPSRLL